jgi:hypothetical protein
MNATRNTLQLSWPVNHPGWTLQVQTNNIASRLGTNWVSIMSATPTHSLPHRWTPAIRRFSIV